ncbi:MAG: TonB family protein [Pseudomonadota bacterium]
MAVLCAGLGFAPALGAQESAVDPKHAAAAARAQREADKVFKWILIHADKPRRGADDKPAAAAAPAPKPMVRTRPETPAEPARTAEISDSETPVAVGKPAAPAALAETAADPVAGPTASAEALPASSAASQASAPSTDTAADAMALAPSTAPAKPAPEPVDMPLVLVHQVDPDFPPAVVRRLQKGSVQVRFEVLPDGSVRDPEVLKTSHARLNTAAVEAVAQWRFQPLLHSQQGIVELVFDIQ